MYIRQLKVEEDAQNKMEEEVAAAVAKRAAEHEAARITAEAEAAAAKVEKATSQQRGRLVEEELARCVVGVWLVCGWCVVGVHVCRCVEFVCSFV